MTARRGLGPPPKASSIAVSHSMKSNRAKGTSPETKLRAALARSGIKGYRLHMKTLPGRPDFAFPAAKLAIFVNGCFWHRCPFCRLPPPKTHQRFWERKFALNMERDQRKSEALRSLGWRVLTIWEHEVKVDLNGTVCRIKRCLSDP